MFCYKQDCHRLKNLKARLPSIKEPKGLLSTDGKWPDGLTNVPWQARKSAV